MLYIILLLGLLFVGIGYILTEKNAEYLLSGYNTMSREERKKFDIVGYVPFFRKFHQRLGWSVILVGSALYFIWEIAAGVFLGVYPIAAYIYFMWAGSRFSKQTMKWPAKISTIGLVATVAWIAVSFTKTLRDNTLHVQDKHLIIDGAYGELIPVAEIKTIELTDTLPEISIRTNGFALGPIRKGHFKTRTGERVKLIINTEKSPLLLVTRMGGEKLFFSSRKKEAAELTAELKESFPSIVESR